MLAAQLLGSEFLQSKPFLSDVTFWVGVAFFLFMAIALKPIAKASGGALDKRSAKIGNELAEAVRLREEAQATLASYQKKQREVHAEAEAMLASAKETARILENEAKEKLRHAVETRISMANDSIARTEQQAVARLQKQVVDTATQSATELFRGELNEEAHEKLLSQAIQESSRLLH